MKRKLPAVARVSKLRTPTRVAAILSLLIATWLSACRPRDEAAENPVEERTFSILAFNDTCRLNGVDEGSRGGLARIRTLRASLEGDSDVLTLLAGDILFPSLLSRLYEGEQVIDVLNGLDGDRESFDERFVVTFGNHEFDKGKLEDAALLDRRIEEAQFTWLGSNLRFAKGEGGEPLVAADQLRRTALRELGGVKVGLFSLTTDYARPAFVESFEDPVETARRYSAELRGEGAEFVIALTHLASYQDTAILEKLGASGPDLVIGGHEHQRKAYEVDGRWVVKADSDALSASVLNVRLSDDGKAVVDHRWEILRDGEPEPDPAVLASIVSWEDRFDEDFCVGKHGLERGCLDEVLGHAAVDLEGEELRIRRFETNLGNWIADLMLDAYADRGAQVAIINSGALRMNQNISAGQPFTRRDLEALFAYPAPLRMVEIDGRTLQQITDRAVSVWSANGWWLQIAGFAFRHDHENQSTHGLTLLTDDGPRRIAPDDRIRLVTISFLLDPELGQDGYTMLRPEQIVDAEGPDLKVQVAEALRAAGEAGIAPRKEGRICSDLEPELCLAVTAE